MSDNALQLTDKVIVITGGANGVGKAAAIECTLRGAKVVIADRDYDAAKNCGIMFFPVIPDKESEGWHAFCDKSVADVLNKRFDSSSNDYLSKFYTCLNSNH